MNMYNGAVEYWFYKALEGGPEFEHRILLRQFNTPVFRECLSMYEWGTLFYLEEQKYQKKPQVSFKTSDIIYTGGNDGKDTKRIH